MTCNLKTRLALLALMCAPSLSAAAHETPVQAAPADVVQELHAFYADQDQANRDGLTSTELAERFYSHDVIITGEGDVAARRGIEASVKALDDWFAYLGPNGNKGCAFAVTTC